jgi:ubiquinone/menaquinone biosynthesis C-methylase UbiE
VSQAAVPLTLPPRVTEIGSYGQYWQPHANTDAMLQIYNTDNPASFEEGGRIDADRLSPYFDASSTVLDLGCGSGRVARYIAPFCATLWAVDASTRMLEFAKDRLGAFHNVRYAKCDDVTIPDVPTGSVDLAYSLLVLQHLEREDAFLLLRELRRVTKPTGVVVVTFPNLLSDTYLQAFVTYATTHETSNPARARIYTPQEVERILPEAGFSAEIDAEREIRAVCRPEP